MTSKQKRFTLEYVRDFNATQAAIRAGYSERTAEQIGYQLLQKTSVRGEIAKLSTRIQERAEWDATQVLIRLSEMADADIADILNDEGGYKPIKEWPVLWRRMLQGCDVEETFERSRDGGDASWDKTGEIVKIKFIDRLKNLELLGKHVAVNAFAQPVEKHEHVHIHLELEEKLTKAREIAAKSV